MVPFGLDPLLLETSVKVKIKIQRFSFLHFSEVLRVPDFRFSHGSLLSK